MKDINFFLPYLDRKKVKFNNKFFLLVIFSLFIIFIVSYAGFNQMRINKLLKGKNELEEVAKDPKIVNKVDLVKSEEEELNRYKLEVETLKELKDQVNEKDFIDSKYIEEIINKKPLDLFITSIHINPESIRITGIAGNTLSIAEFDQGIKSVEQLKDSFISNIIKNETDYTFELESIKAQEEEDGSQEEENDISED